MRDLLELLGCLALSAALLLFALVAIIAVILAAWSPLLLLIWFVFK